MKQKGILRLSVNLLGTSLLAEFLCVVMWSVCVLSDNVFYVVAAQLALFLVYGGLIYGSSWRLGEQEANLIEYGHLKDDPLKGFKIGLLALLPNLLSVALPIAGKLTSNQIFIVVYRFLNPQYIHFMNLFLPAEYENVADLSYLSIFAAFSINLLMPVLSGFAYRLGRNRVSIRQRLMYRKK